MISRMRHPVTALALLLAGATLSAGVLPELPPATLKTLTAQEATRVLAAKAFLESRAATLGLTGADTFQLRHSLTNTQGECVARFDQIHAGDAVKNACIVVKVAPDGACSFAASSLVPGLSVPAAPVRLSAAEAVALMNTKLAPTAGFARQPLAEPILFPASQLGEMILAKDETTGLLSLDPLRSAEGFTPGTPYLRAYRIVGELLGAHGEPSVSLTVVLDAESGAILQRSISGPEVKNPFAYAKGYPATVTGLAAAPPLKVAAQATAPVTAPTLGFGTPSLGLVPTVGYGLSRYVGTVPLPTTFDPTLNGYGLLDTTRGASANHFVQVSMGNLDEFRNWIPNTLRPAGNLVVAANGLTTYVPYTMDGIVGSMSEVRQGIYPDYPAVSPDLVTGLPATTGDPAKDNLWGSGRDFVPTMDRAMAYGTFDRGGQTSAVDALNSLTNGYEFLKYAFNRTGLDGKDSAVTAVVNQISAQGSIGYQTFFATSVDPTTNRVINVPYQKILCGTGIPEAGIGSLAEPTLLGMVQGNMLWEHLVGYSGTSSIYDYRNVQRAFANLMSQGIYSLGSLHGINRRALMAPWVMCMQYIGGYQTSMFKPSLDTASPDAYYDGSYLIGNGNPTWASGPMNRAYFFMSEGASATTTALNHSEFLPEGFNGIGLEKTCKIAFKAVSENLATPFASGADMRTALIQAATDLYGPGSPEVITTTNAWAAVNIGAAYGGPEPVRIWFDMKNFPANSDLGINGPFEANPRSDRYPWVPTGERVQLKANLSGLTGTMDSGLTWSVNPAPFSASGFFDLSRGQNGQITPEGLYLAPLRMPTGSINVTSVQVRSKADTRQWAQGMVMNLAFDWDGDGGNDALDIGMVALAYSLDYRIVFAINDTIFYGFPSVSEGEIQMTLAAFQTAFGN